MFVKHQWKIVYFLPMFTEAICNISTENEGLKAMDITSEMSGFTGDEQVTEKAQKWTRFAGKKNKSIKMF